MKGFIIFALAVALGLLIAAGCVKTEKSKPVVKPAAKVSAPATKSVPVVVKDITGSKSVVVKAATSAKK
jgi:hypothetical protein